MHKENKNNFEKGWKYAYYKIKFRQSQRIISCGNLSNWYRSWVCVAIYETMLPMSNQKFSRNSDAKRVAAIRTASEASHRNCHAIDVLVLLPQLVAQSLQLVHMHFNRRQARNARTKSAQGSAAKAIHTPRGTQWAASKWLLIDMFDILHDKHKLLGPHRHTEAHTHVPPILFPSLCLRPFLLQFKCVSIIFQFV